MWPYLAGSYLYNCEKTTKFSEEGWFIGQSHAVFQGKIYITEHTEKMNAESQRGQKWISLRSNTESADTKMPEWRLKRRRTEWRHNGVFLIESGININYYNHVRLPVLKSFNDSNHTLIQNIACHKVPRDSFHPVSWCSIYWLLSYCVILQAMFKNIGNGNVSHLTELTS